jgi:hypothetical protein
MSLNTVPLDSRSAELKAQLLEATQTLAAALKSMPLVAEERFPFVKMLWPWLADPTALDEAQRNALTTGKMESLAGGFPGDALVTMLNHVLLHDAQLRACCRSILVLAFYLDRFIIHPAARRLVDGASQAEIDLLYRHFEDVTYNQGPYSRTAYTQIFNLSIDAAEIDLEDGLRLVQIHESVVPSLLGESGAVRSFLHPTAAGNVFLATTEAGESSVPDAEWLSSTRQSAHTLVTILQYMKDGIINVGYSVLDFRPSWVNELRKFGLLFIGDPRRLPYKNGTDKYQLDSSTLIELHRWRTALERDSIRTRMNSYGMQMRLTIDRAGTYYEGSLERTQLDERLIALSIALESLFSPSDQSELSYRICQYAALLLGTDPAERASVFDSFREMYKLRSKLVHGAYDVQRYRNGTFVTEDQLRKWADLIRRSILSFIILFLRGCDDTRTLHARLEKTCYDDNEGSAIRAEANIDNFLLQLGL